jgi:hypothetical protein
MPACHAGGRGFESRPVRHIYKKSLYKSSCRGFFYKYAKRARVRQIIGYVLYPVLRTSRADQICSYIFVAGSTKWQDSHFELPALFAGSPFRGERQGWRELVQSPVPSPQSPVPSPQSPVPSLPA